MYDVSIKKRVLKTVKTMPKDEQALFALLLDDLSETGPIQKQWSNFSSLGKGKGVTKYHCHLSYHWVACWTHQNDSILIEVYYAGSRENAPY